MIEQEPGAGIRDVILAAYLLTGTAYLGWRLTAFNPAHPLWATIFYVAEVTGFLVGVLRMGVMRRARMAPTEPPSPPVPWPDIDILVTTYGEPLPIVRRTLWAARQVRGAASVRLLDDAADPAMAALAAELGCLYLPRHTNAGAKAGNLNHGLARSTAPFVAILDADHAPEARFLERLMGYFADPQVAFVQTPQDYFNIDSYQHGHAAAARHMWHEQSLFHWVEQPGRDSFNAATCCGCSMVMRRAALDDIGGFPVDTVTEDMHAAVRLHKKGWRSVYHAEPLAYGIAPASPREFVRQRLRWGEGNMQVCRIEAIPFARNLSIAQNLSYLMLGTTYLEAWLRLAFYCAPLVYLYALVSPIAAGLGAFMGLFLPYFLVTLLAVSELGRGYAPFFQLERFAMARFTAGLGATWGFFRRRIRFRVTSKGLGARGIAGDLAPQIALIILGLGGLATFAAHIASGRADPGDGVGWALAAVGLYFVLIALWVIANGIRAARLPQDAWLAPDPFPVRIAGREEIVHARGLSADTIGLPPQGESAAIEIEIFFAPRSFRVAAHALGNGRWRLDWPDMAARDAFDHALLIAPWRHVLAGRSERAPTMLEALGLLRPPWRGRHAPCWEWGIWEGADASGLCGLRDGRAMLFGAVPAGPLRFRSPTGEAALPDACRALRASTWGEPDAILLDPFATRKGT